MAEAWQLGGAFEREVAVGRNDWYVWVGNGFELSARVAVCHQHVEYELERAFPVSRLTE